jgi:hypothetical protein
MRQVVSLLEDTRIRAVTARIIEHIGHGECVLVLAVFLISRACGASPGSPPSIVCVALAMGASFGCLLRTHSPRELLHLQSSAATRGQCAYAARLQTHLAGIFMFLCACFCFLCHLFSLLCISPNVLVTRHQTLQTSTTTVSLKD